MKDKRQNKILIDEKFVIRIIMILSDDDWIIIIEHSYHTHNHSNSHKNTIYITRLIIRHLIIIGIVLVQTSASSSKIWS